MHLQSGTLLYTYTDLRSVAASAWVLAFLENGHFGFYWAQPLMVRNTNRTRDDPTAHREARGAKGEKELSFPQCSLSARDQQDVSTAANQQVAYPASAKDHSP